MSSAISFNLDQSKTLSSGNGLNPLCMAHKYIGTVKDTELSVSNQNLNSKTAKRLSDTFSASTNYSACHRI